MTLNRKAIADMVEDCAPPVENMPHVTKVTRMGDCFVVSTSILCEDGECFSVSFRASRHDDLGFIGHEAKEHWEIAESLIQERLSS